MQKRRLAGGLVAIGVLAGAWFSGMFGKLGGSGTGTGPGTGATPVVASTRSGEPANANLQANPAAANKSAEVKSVSTKSADPNAKPTTNVATSAKSTKQPDQRTMPDTITTLDIYVRGHNYEVKEPASGAMLRVEMVDLMRLARRAKGDENGIKVRIHRYADARVVGWSRLCAELESAGLQRERDFIMPHEVMENAQAKLDPKRAEEQRKLLEQQRRYLQENDAYDRRQ